MAADGTKTAAPDDDLSMLSEEERDALKWLDADEGQASFDSDIGSTQQPAPPPAAPPVQPPPPPPIEAAAPPVQPVQPPQQAAPVPPPVQQPPAAPPQQATAPAAAPAPVAPNAATAFPKFQAPANADALLAQYDAKEGELARAFDEGELTAEEFRTQQREVDRSRRALEQQMMLADISKTAAEQAYQQNVQSFLAANPMYRPGTREYAYLDTELKLLQSQASAAGQDMMNPALLYQAHANVAQALGRPAPAAAPAGQPAAPPPSILPPPPGYNIPPAFHQIPSAGNTEVADPVVAQLNGLSGEDFEAAFNRLPEDARERFLARMN